MKIEPISLPIIKCMKNYKGKLIADTIEGVKPMATRHKRKPNERPNQSIHN